MDDHVKDEQLYSLFKNFVFEAFPLIDPALDKHWFKPRYDKYPSLKYKENGMPDLFNFSDSGPYKIANLFKSWSGKADIELNEIGSYDILKKYVLSHKNHIDTIYTDNMDKDDRNRYEYLATAIIEDVLERYYLLNKSKQEYEILFKDIYIEIENYIYADKLNFDIGIPILFLQFEMEEFSINENILVRKITDDYQKARFNIRSYSPPVTDSIVAGSTHELVFKNYEIKKGKKYFDTSLNNEKAYPLDLMELFFNAVKIVTNYNSGFAQILVYPHKWTDFYNKDLPTLKGLTVRKYPNYFDDYYWNNDSFPKLSTAEGEEIASFYRNLLVAENNKIRIANRRLRSSYLRDNEEDSILDIIIALETLLSDNEKGELTYKLSMRIAKLLSVYSSNHEAIQVFAAVKKIYEYRSAVVHGSHKSDSKKREVKLHKEGKPIPTISLANDYLREVIGILMQHPKYLDSKEIDKLMLL